MPDVSAANGSGEAADPTAVPRPAALEFFAGIGLARLGLEAAGFRVTWANDRDPRKRDLYRNHFAGEWDTSDPVRGVSRGAGEHFTLADIREIHARDLPAGASLAWASSPCTDLSLAGGRAGLGGTESGTFWEFVRILGEAGGARPPIAVLENVAGLATSRGGRDLAAAVRAFNGLGYSVDVLAIDARRFVPQSRPRLFLVAAQDPPAPSEKPRPSVLRPEWLRRVFADPSLRTHQALLPAPPAPLTSGFTVLAENLADGDPRWWSDGRVAAFRDSLSPIQRQRVAALEDSRDVEFRTAYRRTRRGAAVWEVRADGIAGCLRTARGGSSKQAVVRVGRDGLRVRWMTPRECARLMGAGDYRLAAARTNQALFGFGDAVVVPVVAWLAENYLMPLATRV
jgi:DNA (cytosine-5)-methyltransferase 1